MNVAGILKEKGTRVVTATPTDKVSDVAATLVRERIGAVLVMDDQGGIAGVLSERDIVRGVADRGSACLTLEAQALMTREVFTCKPGDSIEQIMAKLTTQRVRHLPVVDSDGKLAGMISIGDVVKFRLEEIEQEAAHLRDYIVNA